MASTNRSSRATRVLLRVAAVALLTATVAGCADKGANRVGSLSDLPDKDDSMLRLGDASRGAGDCVAALHFYQIVLEKADRPNDKMKANLGLGACYVAMGKFPEAEQTFKEAAKDAPDDPSPLLELGRSYLLAKDPGQAVVALDAAIHKGATSPSPWNDKGIAFDQLRRHKEAQDTYREGLTKYPNDRALRNNLGLSLAMSGEFSEAESLLRSSAQDGDASPRDRQNFALLLGMEGNSEAARALASSDLDGAGVENNLRFYQYARALVTGAPPPAPSSPSSGSGGHKAAALEHRPNGTAPPSSAAVNGTTLDLEPLRSAAATQIAASTNLAAKDRTLFSPPASAITLAANAGSGEESGLPTPLAPLPVSATQPISDASLAGPVASSEGGQP